MFLINIIAKSFTVYVVLNSIRIIYLVSLFIIISIKLYFILVVGSLDFGSSLIKSYNTDFYSTVSISTILISL